MPKAKPAINIPIPRKAGYWLDISKIALDLGFTWGDKPNISKLIEAIARKEFLVLPNNDWTDARIAALDTARKIKLWQI